MTFSRLALTATLALAGISNAQATSVSLTNNTLASLWSLLVPSTTTSTADHNSFSAGSHSGGGTTSWSSGDFDFSKPYGGLSDDWTKKGSHDSLPDLNYCPPSVPEPGTYALMALGLAGVAVAAQRRRKQQG